MSVPLRPTLQGIPALLTDGPEHSPVTVVLAHGAGAPMDSPFMQFMATGLAERGIRTVRFEFPYMAARRSGPRKPPDRAAILVQSWEQVIHALGDPSRLVIGGKSMGGRIASMIADDAGVAGLLVLGYPFHAPGKPQQTRTRHLQDLRVKTLILQGTRDALGSREDVATYSLSRNVQLLWIEEGDHSFKPRARSGRSEKENLEAAVHASADWVLGLRVAE